MDLVRYISKQTPGVENLRRCEARCADGRPVDSDRARDAEVRELEIAADVHP